MLKLNTPIWVGLTLISGSEMDCQSGHAPASAFWRVCCTSHLRRQSMHCDPYQRSSYVRESRACAVTLNRRRGYSARSTCHLKCGNSLSLCISTYTWFWLIIRDNWEFCTGIWARCDNICILVSWIWVMFYISDVFIRVYRLIVLCTLHCLIVLWCITSC